MSIKILMIPKNHEYINRLKFSLEKIGIEVKLLKPFHYSSLMNIAQILFFKYKGYRIIHVHWLYIFPFGFIMKWFYYFCKGFDIKIIWEIHNILPHNYKENDKKYSGWFYEKSDALIFHSDIDVQRSKEVLGSDIKKDYIVIPHGNFNGSYENTISKEEARKILNISDNKRVILCFGFIRKNRGYKYLIEATRDMDNTIVLIAGEIMDKKVYESLVEYKKEIPNLRLFVKWIPNNELQIYFNACDIVVIPYIDITTSGVIPLAYAFSRAVVTTSIGGINDVVNKNTGILVPPENAEALRNAINKIFTMDFDVMGRYANEYAKKKFDWRTNALKIKNLYESLLIKN